SGNVSPKQTPAAPVSYKTGPKPTAPASDDTPLYSAASATTKSVVVGAVAVIAALAALF
ncbi:hypothetical protein HKX48_003243, partial [Thoreauomyces humboldtii]